MKLSKPLLLRRLGRTYRDKTLIRSSLHLFHCRFTWRLLLLVIVITPNAVDADCKSDPTERHECQEPIAAETTRGIALGTGLRSSAISSSALAYNTAALPLGGLYHIEGNLDYQPSNEVVGLGAVVVDSVTSKLAAGISFRGFISSADTSDENRRDFDGIDVYLGLGYPLGEAVSLGIAGRYNNFWRSDVPVEDFPVDSTEDDTLAKGLNLDASFRIMPASNLQFALLAYNVVYDKRDSPYVPVMVGGSFSFNIDKYATLGLDGLADVTSFEGVQFLIGAGGEYFVSGIVPLRLGYRFDTGRETHDVTGGVGYTDRHFGVDLSLRQRVSGGDETRLMAALRFYVY